MSAINYYKLTKYSLIFPFLDGLLHLIELALPLQTITTNVVNKAISTRARFGTTTYSVDFTSTNDQFSESVYNTLAKNDTVTLKVAQFSKEVREVYHHTTGNSMQNDTGEIYIQTLLALAAFIFSIWLFRKPYYTNRHYRYSIVLILFGFFGLLRLFKLNF